MDNSEESEMKFSQMLYEKGFLIGQKIYTCGNSNFAILYHKNYKISKCIFRCKNPQCKYRRSIRTNSFYTLFPKLKLRLVSEIIKFYKRNKYK